MTWPAVQVKTNFDQSSDDPKSARSEIAGNVDKFNQLQAHVSSYIQGVLDDANAAAARATLGVPAAASGTHTGTTVMAAVTVSGKVETNGELQIDDVVQTIAEVISSGAGISLSMAGKNKKTIALATNTTITVADEVADQIVEVWITQTSGGGTAAWSGVNKWIGGSAPTLSTTTGQIDIIILTSASDGSTIIAQHLGVAS